MVHDTKTHTPLKEHQQLVWYVKWISSIIIVLAMIATINAVKFLKLKPIIIDVDPETYTLNCEEIKKYVTTKTKCVIHVSLNNRYNKLNELETPGSTIIWDVKSKFPTSSFNQFLV